MSTRNVVSRPSVVDVEPLFWPVQLVAFSATSCAARLVRRKSMSFRESLQVASSK